MFSPIFSIYNEKQEVIIPAKSIKRISNILKFFAFETSCPYRKKESLLQKNRFPLIAFLR